MGKSPPPENWKAIAVQHAAEHAAFLLKHESSVELAAVVPESEFLKTNRFAMSAMNELQDLAKTAKESPATVDDEKFGRSQAIVQELRNARKKKETPATNSGLWAVVLVALAFIVWLVARS
jgi:hypothetical protein